MSVSFRYYKVSKTNLWKKKIKEDVFKKINKRFPDPILRYCLSVDLKLLFPSVHPGSAHVCPAGFSWAFKKCQTLKQTNSSCYSIDCLQPSHELGTIVSPIWKRRKREAQRRSISLQITQWWVVNSKTGLEPRVWLTSKLLTVYHAFSLNAPKELIFKWINSKKTQSVHYEPDKAGGRHHVKKKKKNLNRSPTNTSVVELIWILLLPSIDSIFIISHFFM